MNGPWTISWSRILIRRFAVIGPFTNMFDFKSLPAAFKMLF
jgi:hypothetical protein